MAKSRALAPGAAWATAGGTQASVDRRRTAQATGLREKRFCMKVFINADPSRTAGAVSTPASSRASATTVQAIMAHTGACQ